MATLQSIQSGNMLDSTTWGLCAGGEFNLLTNGVQTITTTPVASPSFTLNSIGLSGSSSGTSSTLGATGSNPQGICIDSLGNVYIANFNSNNVTKITPSGVSTILGTTGSNPFGICIDSLGNVYTSNDGSNNVTKITSGGTSTILGTTGNVPFSICVDSLGNVFVGNFSDNTITKITSGGTSTIFSTLVTQPEGICVDTSGNVYVANNFGNNVTKITSGGTSSILGTTGSSPKGICIDSFGTLYIANYNDSTVTKITSGGTSTLLGTTGSNPQGICVDSFGNVYTNNFNSNNVTKITPSGISIIFGTTGTNPAGICIDSSGNIYTSNNIGNTVTKITPSSTIPSIKGITLFLNGTATAQSGTITTELFDVTTSGSVSSVTININDLPNTSSISAGASLGPVFFNFNTPVTLNNTDNYAVRLSTSVANMTSVFLGNYGSNLLLSSEDISVSSIWISDQTMGRVSNTINSPIGTLTADKLTENLSLATQNLYQNRTCTPDFYNFSLYAKVGERNIIRVILGNAATQLITTGVDAYFDLTAGTVSVSATSYGLSTSPNASISNEGNGWYRCSISANIPINGTMVSGIQIRQNNTNIPYSGTSGSGVYVWGAQLTQGATLQPYQSAGTVTNNYYKTLVTSTNQIPSSSDTMIITGVYSAASANTATTVTMNSTGNTIPYGYIYTSAKGTLSYADTNTKLKVGGMLNILYGGTLNIGTSGTPITTSASLEMFCTTNGQWAIQNIGGTFNTFGVVKTNFRAKLNADVSSGATSSITDITTGWKNGDKIVIPSTSRTYTEWEVITLSADTSGTTMNHSPYLNAHGGNAVTYVQADIGNVSRNINIFSTNNNQRGNIQLGTSSNSNLKWTTFYDLGVVNNSATINNVALFVASNATTHDCQFNVFTCTQPTINTANLYNNGLVNSNSSNNVFYGSLTNTAATVVINVNIACNNIDNMVMIGTNSASNAGNNCVFASLATHMVATFLSGVTIGNIYSNNLIGFYTLNMLPTQPDISGLRIWRNNNSGVVLNNGSSTKLQRDKIIKFSNFIIFGNNGFNIGSIASAYFIGKIIFENSYIYGDSTYPTSFGIDGNTFSTATLLDSLYLNNCVLGKDPNGNSIPFTSSCIRANANQNIFLNNCTFNGTEATLSTGGISYNSNQGIISTTHNGIQNVYKMWTNNGIHSSDTIIYNNSSPSLRITPQSSTLKSFTPNIKIPVKSGQSATISVNVRKSITGDGINYNGNQPRLIYVYNPVAGNLIETIGASGITSNGIWEKLTYTTLPVQDDTVAEFYVDCDGTTGWINVDDWKSKTSNDSRGTNFISTMGTYVEADYYVKKTSKTYLL